ncbi:unnamed protein product [Brassicogethes aeneus]|uniref:Uncharacterized protein n=1 Tax=Brassicogethes aeneus TaxID=1431903 RepID=A0A9P0BAK3_BRAAE|nr:unnamed protein product [Brassicogethes aeneus]
MLIDADTQTENKVEPENGKIRIEKIDSWEAFTEVTDQMWEEYQYSNTEIKIGNPLETEDTITKVVMIEPTDPKLERGIQKIYAERYPELISDSKSDIVEQRIYTRTGNTEKETRKKIIKASITGTENDLWDNILKIKQEITNEKRVAMHTLKGIETERLRKIVECVFHGTDTQVHIFKQGGKSNSSGKQRTTYALVLENAGKSYVARETKKRPPSCTGTARWEEA